MKELLTQIAQCLPAGGAWCSLEKAQTMAALIVGLRPRCMVEIGVWMGGSAIPMVLALKHNKAGKLVAIDPWSADASISGQTGDNVAWWAKVDHDRAYQTFVERLAYHDAQSYCEVVRKKSDDVDPPWEIDLLHVDGNHGEQAIRDVERFADHVVVGGILVIDDVNWTGGAVAQAVTVSKEMGFAELYPLGTGLVMQRRA